MAKASKRRSRKRRSGAGAAGTLGGSAGATVAVADDPKAEATGGRQARSQRRASSTQAASRRGGGQTPVSRRYGERPRPPWHPLPLAELLILVGAIGVVIGFRRGISHGGAPLLAGIAAVALGTLEVTLREHRGGFRSHTVMLAALPVVVFHSVVALVVSAFTRVPAIATVGLLGLDLVLFLLMFRLLRSNFLTARTRAAGRG